MEDSLCTTATDYIAIEESKRVIAAEALQEPFVSHLIFFLNQNLTSKVKDKIKNKFFTVFACVVWKSTNYLKNEFIFVIDENFIKNYCLKEIVGNLWEISDIV